jgi:uncharacterized protein YrzB (UPF0473 family)
MSHNHEHEHDHDHEHENVVILTDEDGNDTEFLIEASFELDGNEYAVLFPAHSDGDEGYIFRVKDDGEEAIFENIEGEEFDKVAEHYYNLLEEGDFDDIEDDEE